MPRGRPDEEGGVVLVPEKNKVKPKRPPLYKVLFHNDDYTTREFVVFVLQTVFHLGETEAVRVMWHVHTQGVGVAGVFTFEVAETKARKVEELARENEFPLRVSVEPEE
jgi:ATP-dependent Clp protease adaptor protein ClpS